MKTNSILKSYTTLKAKVGFKRKFSPMKNMGFSKTPTSLQKDIKDTDREFSKFIVRRDGKCMRCGSTQMLSCSHFHGRANYATRFEPMNCITFCVVCHDFMESKKSGEYLDFMVDWLGRDRFFVLDSLSKIRISKVDSLILAKNLLKKVEDNSEIQYLW